MACLMEGIIKYLWVMEVEHKTEVQEGSNRLRDA